MWPISFICHWTTSNSKHFKTENFPRGMDSATRMLWNTNARDAQVPFRCNGRSSTSVIWWCAATTTTTSLSIPWSCLSMIYAVFLYHLPFPVVLFLAVWNTPPAILRFSAVQRCCGRKMRPTSYLMITVVFYPFQILRDCIFASDRK